MYFQADVVYQYKYGTIYRDVLKVKRFDWCDAMDRRSSQNIVIKFLIDLAEENVPDMIHPCPYSKVIVDKVSVKTATVGSLFPSGDYKVIINTSDADGNFLGSVLTVFSINSSIKTTFG